MIRLRLMVPLLVVDSLMASFAFACACSGHPTTEDEARRWIENSDVVMLVRIHEHVQRQWAEGLKVKSDDYYAGVVIEGFKGVASGSGVLIQTNYSIQSCAVRYRPSDTYLVFGQGPTLDGRVHAALCRSFLYETTLEAASSHHELLKSNLELVLGVLRSE